MSIIRSDSSSGVGAAKVHRAQAQRGDLHPCAPQASIGHLVSPSLQQTTPVGYRLRWSTGHLWYALGESDSPVDLERRRLP